MMKKSLPKKLMLVAGILAAAIILFSQAFQKETCSFLSKVKHNKTEKPVEAEKKTIIATPKDAVTSSQAVEVGDTDASLIREIVYDDDSAPTLPFVDKAPFLSLITTFLRAVISPQAP
jgi:hypothetical protein